MSKTGVAIKYLKRFTKWKIILALLIIALIVTIAVATSIGPFPISPLEVLNSILQKIPFLSNIIKVDLTLQEIVLNVRLPRVLVAALVGIALATSGTVLQGLLRNPIADPFIIGISAGASLGASAALVSGIGASIFGGILYSVPIAAFISALGTVFLIYNLSKIGGSISMLTLLLIGVAITSLFSALVYLILLISNEQSQGILFWMFGSLTLAGWNYFYMAFPFVVVGLIVILYFARDLNPIALGEEQAQHLGVEIETLKKILLACVSLITAAVVSITGMIGFIGLIIPHIMRLLVGSDHRMLIPSSALAGAIVLILCDTVSRMVIRPAEVPVSIITAILGCPFFIYLLLRSRRGSFLSRR